MKKKFSVAIATSNNKSTIERALKSVFDQIHDYSFEVVISDDCSDDGTVEIIESYKSKFPEIIKTDYNSGSIGFSKNSIQNLNLCMGEYIVKLFPQDFWLSPFKIQTQISFLDKSEDYILSTHRYAPYYEDTQLYGDKVLPKLFIEGQEGFDFGTERYFDYWLTQSSTVVFRNKSIENIPCFFTYKYTWETQLYWFLLNQGKGYAHNFLGSAFSVTSEGISGVKYDILKQNCLNFLIIKELHYTFPDNTNINRILNVYNKNLAWSKSANRRQLDASKLVNKCFTIISDDNWGEEVYKAFDLPFLTPFIGVYIFNSDFVKLSSNFKFYIKLPLRFIPYVQTRKKRNFKYSTISKYPVALLGGEIELHFYQYETEEEVEKKWNERKEKIVWDNLFFKMDASRECPNVKEIEKYLAIKDITKACFINVHDKDDYKEVLNSNEVIFIDYWNPNEETFFPLSLSSFDLVGWLNKKNTGIKNSLIVSEESFSPVIKRNHFFVQFTNENTPLIDCKFHPESYSISYKATDEAVSVRYDKSELEYFCLAAQEKDHPKSLDLFIDLSEEGDRHIFVLIRGEENSFLRVDFIAKDNDEKDVILHLNDFSQPIDSEFQWLHFNFSFLKDPTSKLLFSRIRSFYFYINPGEKAQGEVELLAFFAGSEQNFFYQLNRIKL